LKITRTLTTTIDSSMEMGGHHYGFCVWVPIEKKDNDAIWVIVKKLMKSTLFLSMKMTDSKKDNDGRVEEF
jgi:hypothetical protein